MDEAGLFVEADAGDVGAVDFGDEAMAIEFDSAGEERPEESFSDALSQGGITDVE